MASRAASAKLRQSSGAPSSSSRSQKPIRDEPDPDWASAAAALLVLAGISASDAACCKALGRRSRGEDHHDAEVPLALIDPGGTDAANAMRRPTNVEDKAHDGFYNVSAKDMKTAFTQAGKLVRFARSVLRTPIASRAFS